MAVIVKLNGMVIGKTTMTTKKIREAQNNGFVLNDTPFLAGRSTLVALFCFWISLLPAFDLLRLPLVAPIP